MGDDVDQDAWNTAAALIRAQFDPELAGYQFGQDPPGHPGADSDSPELDRMERQFRATLAIARQARRHRLTTVTDPTATMDDLRAATQRLSAVLFATVHQAGYYAHLYAEASGRTALAVVDEVADQRQPGDYED